MDLATDELGRRWVQVQLEDPHQCDQALVTLMYADPRGNSHTIGNGFVVLDQKNAAICLTAAHNFEYIKRLQASRSVSGHPTIPVDFAIKGKEYIDTLGVHALYLGAKRPVFCKVDQINYQANYDVAVFQIHFDPSDSTPAAFSGKIGIDLAIPRVGDEVAVLGHLLREEDRGNGEFLLERHLQFHWGFVTAVTPGPGRLSQHYSFETTIPMRPGLSGSPILRKPEMNGSITACGVVSFDFSVEDAFQNFLVAGSSHAAALWPSVALGFVGQLEEEAPKFIRLQELLDRKLIFNFSDTKATTTIIDTDHTSDIYYQDSRSNPPDIHKLTTPRNPLGLEYMRYLGKPLGE